MKLPALPSSYPKWCRVLAAIVVTLIVVAPLGLILLFSLGWDPDATEEPSTYDYYGDSYGSNSSGHWFEYLGFLGFFFSELHPLLWLARGGRRGRAGRMALFGILAHVIVTATLLLIAASYDLEDVNEGFVLVMVAFTSQLAWSIYYAAILRGEERPKRAILDISP
jgi:hypothetical protein